MYFLERQCFFLNFQRMNLGKTLGKISKESYGISRLFMTFKSGCGFDISLLRIITRLAVCWEAPSFLENTKYDDRIGIQMFTMSLRQDF